MFSCRVAAALWVVPTALPLHAERHVLIDPTTVLSMSGGVERRLHPPTRAGTVLVLDAPWEGAESGYASVLDAGDGTWRLYYRGGGELSREVTCVATSTDGATWERPTLGLVAFDGSTANNIVWTAQRASYGESHNFFALRDPRHDVAAASRWRAVALGWDEVGPDERYKALVPLDSPDGLRWRRVSSKPIITKGRGFDSLNIVVYDGALDRFRCFSRVGLDGYRHIQVSESADFVTWTHPEPIVFDPPARTHFYTNAVTLMPALREDDDPPLYVGMPMRFVPDRKRVLGRETDGTSDAVVIASRDGVRWSWSPREAWIRPGPAPDNWGHAHGNQTPVQGILATSPEVWSVYWIEGYGSGTPRVVRGTIRPEGFVSLHAGERGGTARLGPFALAGRRVALNMATSATGMVRVAVLDAEGNAMAGYSLAEAEPLWGDSLQANVGWTDGRDTVAADATSARFLDIELFDADVFAVRVVAP